MVRVLGVTFIEDIVTFDPPNHLEYRAKKCRVFSIVFQNILI